MEVNKMNNSFTKLGEEEWEECLFNNGPKHEANGECEICVRNERSIMYLL